MASNGEMSSPRLLITVHGIRTYGHWQERLGRMVTESGANVTIYNYKYGYFSVLAFMIPMLRWWVTRRFKRDLVRVVNQRQWRAVDIVAHSFGTHLVAWSLLALRDSLRVDTVIFAGSVLKSTFDWREIVGTAARRVINECGAHDSILVLNQLFVLFTGMAGRVGFSGMTGPELVNRFYLFGHSGFFEPTGGTTDADIFMRECWVPLLTQGAPAQPCDERGIPTIVEGLITFALNNSEPVKLTLLLVPVVIATVLITSSVKEKSRLEKEAQDRRDRLIVASAQQLVDDDPSGAIANLANLSDNSALWKGAWLVANGALDRGVAVRYPDHKEAVSALVASPDELRVASAARDGSISIRTADGKPVARLDAGVALHHMLFIDSNHLATTDASGALRVWDIASKQQRALTSLGDAPRDGMFSLAVAPDGKYAAIGHPGEGRLRVVELSSGRVGELTVDDGAVWALMASPDSQWLCARGPATTTVWNLRTGERHTRRYVQWPSDATFAPRDSALFVVQSLMPADFAGKISLAELTAKRDELVMWDFIHDTVTAKSVGNCTSPDSITFGPDGRLAAVRENGAELCVWNADSPEPYILKTEESEAETGTISLAGDHKAKFSADGRVAAVVSQREGKALRLWQIEKRRGIMLRGHQDSPVGVVVLENGKRIITADTSGAVYYWSAPTTPVLTAEKPWQVGSTGRGSSSTFPIALTSDGSLALHRLPRDFQSPTSRELMRLWDFKRGSVIDIDSAPRFVTSADFDAAGKVMIMTGGDGSLQLWDPKSGRLLAKIATAVGFARISGDGHTVVALNERGIRAWTLAISDGRWTALRVSTIARREMESVAVSGDGAVVAGVTADELIVWHSAEEAASYALPSPVARPIAVSYDGSRVAVPHHNGVSVFDVANGLVAQFVVRDASVESIALSRNGDYLAAFADDGVVRVWHVDSASRRVFDEDRGLTSGLVAFSANDELTLAGDYQSYKWTLAAPPTAAGMRSMLARMTNRQARSSSPPDAAPTRGRWIASLLNSWWGKQRN